MTLLRIAYLEPGAQNLQLKQGEFGALIPSDRRKGGGVGRRNKRGRRNAKIPRRHKEEEGRSSKIFLLPHARNSKNCG